MLAIISGIAKFGVTAVQHLFDILMHSVADRESGGRERIKMIIKNLLQNIHAIIISENSLPPKIGGQGG
jgi:hypothetical protein